jgi:alanyl-tRNA synthetase
VKSELKNKVESVNGNSGGRSEGEPRFGTVFKGPVFPTEGRDRQPFSLVLGATIEGKPLLSIMISDNLVKEKGLHAGQIVREAAKEMNGGGGGQPFYAHRGIGP